MLQGELDDVGPGFVREAVPDRARVRRRILQPIKPAFRPAVIPAVIGRAGNAEHGQRLANWQMRGFDGADDLQLFRCGIPHASYSPSPIMLFSAGGFPGSGRPRPPSTPPPRNAAP